MTTEENQIDAVSRQIRDMSDEGPLPAERQLAEQLGVNRYVLRKALGELRATQEIPESRPRNQGKRHIGRQRVAKLTSPAEVWEGRLLIEPDIARMAAARGTIAEISAILDIHAGSEPDLFDLEKDIAFHTAIAAASHNALSSYLIELIADLTRDPGFRMRLPEFTSETGWRHHQMIADALRNRRAAEAKAAMQLHLSEILKWLNGGEQSAFSSVRSPASGAFGHAQRA
ncbi:FadR family transcriptional regulator [Thioclava sp. BHET1]|nr:FadR family transcriptional regulator [Thioclava sp. BHET1]